MDYKSVLEEQIRELQKVQDKNVREDLIHVPSVCDVSKLILEYVKELNKNF